ncbi:PfkB family carbohydrate kinase [Shimia sp.]|uniref:PfkB family carbohydrate kinase n=1 Tax=Shimia sp. TaxID=1954381 RepID=UPI003298B813
MNKVLCVGAAVVDFVFHLETLPDKAEKYGTESAAIVGGGCAANSAVAVSRLGGEAILGARLGDDPIGDLVIAGLAGDNVDTSNVTRTPGARSSYSSVFIDQRGERQIVNFRGQGLVLDTSWFDSVQNLGAVLTDTRRVSAARDALMLAQQRGIPGILDGEAPVDPNLVALASHAAFSLQGLRDLVPGTTPQEALTKLRAEHGCWVCVTDGENGVWFTDQDNMRHVPAFEVDPVDTLGAGDVWHGAFALALCEGQSELNAIRFANAAAALKCTKSGGREGAPTRSETEQFLKEKTT